MAMERQTDAVDAKLHEGTYDLPKLKIVTCLYNEFRCYSNEFRGERPRKINKKLKYKNEFPPELIDSYIFLEL